MESNAKKVAAAPYLQQQILHLALISVFSVLFFISLQHYVVHLGEEVLLLKYPNLVVDMVCIFVVMILSEFAAGKNFNEEEEFGGAGLTAAALVLVLTTLPQFAQGAIATSDTNSGTQFVTCVLVTFQGDSTYLGSTDYRSFFRCFFLLNLVWACTCAFTLYKIRSKSAPANNSVPEFPILLTVMGLILASASLTTYIAIEHTVSRDVVCSYAHLEQRSQAFSAVFALLPLYTLFSSLIARSYTVKVVLPILNNTLKTETKAYKSLSLSTLLLPPILTIVFMYQFAAILAQTDGVPGLIELFKIVVRAIVNLFSVLRQIFTEVIPNLFVFCRSIVLAVAKLIIYVLAEGGFLSRLSVVAVLSIFVFVILKRTATVLYRFRHYYPHFLLFVLLVFLSVIGGYLFGFHLSQNNAANVIEIDTQKLTK